MAANKCPVTPERVRKILSSFLSDETKKVNFEEDKQDSTSPTSKSEGSTNTQKVKEHLNLRSREAFFQRVETFSPLSWFAKPEELSALVCAQYGWENTEVDMLQCVSCKAFLCGKLPSNTDQQAWQPQLKLLCEKMPRGLNVAYKEACRRLKSSIITAHEKMCTWSTNPAPDWYMQVPHYDPEEVRQDFQQRYQTLKAVRETLPEINYTKLMDFGFDTYRCGKLTFSLDQTSEEGMKKAAALAVTGWSMNENNIMLVCDHCRRHAGLWNFKAASGNNVDTNGNADPPLKKQKLEMKESFDPADEHRTFCPWIKLKQEGNTAVDTSPSKTQSTTNPNGSLQQFGSQSDQNGKHNTPVVWKSPGFNSSQTSDISGFNNSQRLQNSQTNNSQIMQSPRLNTSQDSNTSSDSLGSPDPSIKKVMKSPGWVHNLKIIAPTLLSGDQDSFSSTVKKSPMIVGLRSIRRLFRDWASPDISKPS